MPFNNPFAAPEFDMQDIRGEQYGLFNPVRMILRGEGLAYLISAHIGFDRTLGYGLKFPLGFRVTHLGTLKGVAVKE